MLTEKRWDFQPIPEQEKIDKLAKALNISALNAGLLLQRGINSFDEAKAFFRPKLEDLHNPFEMQDMEAAVNRIEAALEEGETIMVFGDYDVSWTELATTNQASISYFYAVNSVAAYNDPAIDAYRADVEMLSQFSADDPEIFANNTGTVVAPPIVSNIANHHAFHVREIKEMADAVGIPNVCYYGKNPVIYEDPSGETLREFIVRKISE